MRGLGEYLAERDITAPGVRLAGYATSPQDMRCTNWHDWWVSARESYQQLRQMCDPVFVCGLSMGGTFVLHLGAHYPEVAGVIAIFYESRIPDELCRSCRAKLADWFRCYGGRLRGDFQTKTLLIRYATEGPGAAAVLALGALSNALRVVGPNSGKKSLNTASHWRLGSEPI